MKPVKVAVFCHPDCTPCSRELSVVLSSAGGVSEGAVRGAAINKHWANKDVTAVTVTLTLYA